MCAKRFGFAFITVAVGAIGLAACTQSGTSEATYPDDFVPSWVQDAVFYQVFPERFRNGDPANDPTRQSLVSPFGVPNSWTVTPWTADWYERASWEVEKGPAFYFDGVQDRRFGGDLQGVIDGLDYLQDLGITAIYLNPVFYSPTLHKYDTIVYHHVDPFFGPDPAGDVALIESEAMDPEKWGWTAADRLFLELVSEVHRRGMRVVIDGVFNHVGREFVPFDDVRQRQDKSVYHDWFAIDAFDDPATPMDEFRYRSYDGGGYMPKVAASADGDDLAVGPKRYFFDITSRWMDPNRDGDPTDGVDGWRLDVANMVPAGFWDDWNGHVRRLNPEAYTVAEMWEDAAEFVKEARFSATMNYHAFSIPTKAFFFDRTIDTPVFLNMLASRQGAFSQVVQPALLNIIDSHDTPRLASMIVNATTEYVDPPWFDYDRNATLGANPTYDVRKPDAEERMVQRLTALFQMTWVGAPMVYYGTEAGMWGADDPDDRMPMVWPEMAYDVQRQHPFGSVRPADAVAFDSDLHAYYRSVIGLRKATPALRSASYEAVGTSSVPESVCFLRGNGPVAGVLVCLNRSNETANLRISRSDEVVSEAGLPKAVFVSSGDLGDVAVESSASTIHVRLPAVTGAVMRFDEPE